MLPGMRWMDAFSHVYVGTAVSKGRGGRENECGLGEESLILPSWWTSDRWANTVVLRQAAGRDLSHLLILFGAAYGYSAWVSRQLHWGLGCGCCWSLCAGWCIRCLGRVHRWARLGWLARLAVLLRLTIPIELECGHWTLAVTLAITHGRIGWSRYQLLLTLCECVCGKGKWEVPSAVQMQCILKN